MTDILLVVVETCFMTSKTFYDTEKIPSVLQTSLIYQCIIPSILLTSLVYQCTISSMHLTSLLYSLYASNILDISMHISLHSSNLLDNSLHSSNLLAPSVNALLKAPIAVNPRQLGLLRCGETSSCLLLFTFQ